MFGKSWIFSICLLALVFAGCATGPSVTETEAPPPVVSHRFEFNPPEKTNKKAEITIGIVAPMWDKNISATGEGGKQALLDAGINPNPQEALMLPNMTAHAGPAPQELLTIAKDFHNAVTKDFEAMMVTRGFPTMGPFKDVDEMTYPQKTACNLIMVPEFSQIIRSQPSEVITDLIQGTAVIRTEIVLNIYEPLSREKLWTKRFTNESKRFSYRVRYNIETIRDKDGRRIGVRRQGIAWDNRPASFAQGFMDLYQEVMTKSWAYFSPEEMAVLKQHSEEIRAKKRF
jgi:hypothetical protein